VALEPSLVTVHGELDQLSTVVSHSYIIPVVGTIDSRPTLTPHDREVDRICGSPSPSWRGPTPSARSGGGTPPLDRRVFFFELDDETIWGATGRMVYQLLRIAHGVEGPEPDAV
jgi:hypothetical protein